MTFEMTELQAHDSGTAYQTHLLNQTREVTVKLPIHCKRILAGIFKRQCFQLRLGVFAKLGFETLLLCGTNVWEVGQAMSLSIQHSRLERGSPLYLDGIRVGEVFKGV
jgi:hypothetical protein